MVSFTNIALILILFSATYILTNVELYIPLFAAFLILLTKQKFFISKKNLLLIIYLYFVATYGVLLAFQKGANLSYSLKFAVPLLALASFISIKDYRDIILQNHRLIILISFIFSIFAMLIIKLELDSINALVLRGWSVSLSKNHGISAWHYFSFSLSSFYIYVYFYHKGVISQRMAVLCAFQLISLIIVNGTGSFLLANLIFLLLIFPVRYFSSLIVRSIFFIVALLLIDYFSFQYISNGLINIMRSSLSGDRGDLIRIIQIEYFLNNVSFWGNGFGTLLHFDFNEVPDRAAQHSRFPYASEVVFLNYMNGGGIFIAFILLFFSRNVLFCLHYFFIRRNRLDAFLGISCSAVLVGSLSNPFLLSPVSILLLAVSYECYKNCKADKNSFTESIQVVSPET